MTKNTIVIGASGYTGLELLRIIADHPYLQLTAAIGSSSVGESLYKKSNHLRSYKEISIKSYQQAQEEINSADIIFCALPHGTSRTVISKLHNKTIIDLSADHRLDSFDEYKKWYAPSLNKDYQHTSWQYGLTEVYRKEISQTQKIANPGCYPTSILIPLIPLLQANCINTEINICSYSGVSGAGFKENKELNFSHLFEDMKAYKLGCHQHLPEIKQELQKHTKDKVQICFTTHLAPISRGIHSTITVKKNVHLSLLQIISKLKEFYSDENFIHIEEDTPGTKSVRSTNCCKIHVGIDKETDQLIITSVIDNLIKGAAGQAIQNANLIFGFPEDTGLSINGVYP